MSQGEGKTFSELFKEFQVKLLDAVQERDETAYVTYSQDPNGIAVQIHSESFGMDEFMVVNTPEGADFIRLFRA